MATSPNTTVGLIPRLRAALDGQVIATDDADYDQTRRVFSANFDHRRPGVIVRPANDADVAHVVTIATEADAELAVRSGGHSPAGHSTTDGGVVVDLRDLNEVRVDTESRTAWVQAGATAGSYVTATAEHGLTTGLGDTGSVGIGGITLAGGAGFLSRKYGLTVDELLAADVVTADGQQLRVDAENHPDLFWAIRGGGGNFGVVTQFKFRLRDVSEFVGGLLVLPATPEVIARFVAEADAAPDELTTIMNATVAPPAPFLPPEAHGKHVVMAQLAYAGSADAADAVLAPFRAIAKPLVDMIGPKPYSAMFPPGPELHPVTTGRAMFVNTVDDDVAGTVVEQLHASTAMMPIVQFRVLGGAVGRVPVEATAFAHRDQRVMLNITAIFQQLQDLPEHEAWAVGLRETLDQGPGVYAGFLGADGADRIREAYPGATWDRLVAVKRHYDPTNLFRHNHNISAG